jgi:hypothetical protein
MMDLHDTFRVIRRTIIRCANPSFLTISVSLLLAMISTAIGLVQGSVSAGSPALPATPGVVPTAATPSLTYNPLPVFVFLLGLAFCFALAAFLSGKYARLHGLKKMDRSARSAELRWLGRRAIWRVALSVVLLIAVPIFGRLLHLLVHIEYGAANDKRYLHAAATVIGAVAAWAVLYYLMIVFVRLYLLRARIFSSQ